MTARGIANPLQYGTQIVPRSSGIGTDAESVKDAV
jgi:hypothetical protein